MMETVHGFEPVLKKKHFKSPHSTPPWVLAQEVIANSKRWTENEKDRKRRYRALLIERWGHVPIIQNVFALIECHKKTIELLEELLMGLLVRLDWNKPIVRGEADVNAIGEITGAMKGDV